MPYYIIVMQAFFYSSEKASAPRAPTEDDFVALVEQRVFYLP